MEDCPQYAAANLPTELCCVDIRAPNTAALSYLPNNLERCQSYSHPLEGCTLDTFFQCLLGVTHYTLQARWCARGDPLDSL